MLIFNTNPPFKFPPLTHEHVCTCCHTCYSFVFFFLPLLISSYPSYCVSPVVLHSTCKRLQVWRGLAVGDLLQTRDSLLQQLLTRDQPRVLLWRGAHDLSLNPGLAGLWRQLCGAFRGFGFARSAGVVCGEGGQRG